MLPLVDSALEILLQFLKKQDQFVFLDTSRPDAENYQSLLFIEPKDRLVCKAGDSLHRYLDSLQQQLDNGYYLAGWVGYEFGALLEGGIKQNMELLLDSKMVIADLGVFSKPMLFDHQTGESDFPFHLTPSFTQGVSEHKVSNLHPNMTREEFVAALGTVREYIEAGDTYQVNYTMKLLFDFEGSVEQFYRLLRKNQSVGYGAYIRSRQESILSFSPELFFKKQGNEITVRPMKGTAPRGRYLKEDNEIIDFLHNDIKNRSENVMIVDLLRNDLARLMHGHGKSRVYVDSLFDVETYESLLQMTSTIKAACGHEKMQQLQLTDLFKALFPCGSITGAPKIRTMQIIDELEKDRRGVYTGAIGYFGPDGSAAFNVPIRTVRLTGTQGEMGIGAGITYDSVAEDEWEESLLKGKFLIHSKPEFQLFETILYSQNGDYFLLDEHLDRLESAAGFFRFNCDIEIIRGALEERAEQFQSKSQRVRLVLAKDGRVTVEAMDCVEPVRVSLPVPGEKVRAAGLFSFSPDAVDTNSPYRFHKTTLRKEYDEAYARACRDGLFDYVFCNEAGEVTEGCITNIIIFKAGEYKTPPIECGLLPGVMRNHLLNDQSRSLVEERLTREDVAEADAVYLCNSVRGVVKVELAG